MNFDPAKADLAKYFEQKVKPQVRELLTQYGPVALIWFDTPKNIPLAQSGELTDLVHTLQPACLVAASATTRAITAAWATTRVR